LVSINGFNFTKGKREKGKGKRGKGRGKYFLLYYIESLKRRYLAFLLERNFHSLHLTITGK